MYELLDTEVDELLMVLFEKHHLSIDEASKIMGVDPKVMQRWVDFLVEEKILILDYNFFTPTIRLTDEKKKDMEEKKEYLVKKEKDAISKRIGIKGEFFKAIRKRGINAERGKILWKKFVDVNASDLKKEFLEKARMRDIEDNKLDELWNLFFQVMKT